jgi:hypothetical protein
MIKNNKDGEVNEVTIDGELSQVLKKIIERIQEGLELCWTLENDPQRPRIPVFYSNIEASLRHAFEYISASNEAYEAEGEESPN